MTYDEALNYINDFTWSTSRLGLERTRELLEMLGNPQKKLKFIHVAGTNGKGSTCAMLSSILKEAGFKVGLYPSPYLEDFRERIEVNGEMISKEDLCDITEKVRKEADAMADHPSQFELITAIGMLYYVKMHCDIVVLEVGMGGTLDSTNVIDAPEVAVITNIGLDHTEFLGDTIEKIAETKAGIIKSGSDVVAYANVSSVIDVIRRRCDALGDKLYLTDGLIKEISHSLVGQRFIYYRSAETKAKRTDSLGKQTIEEKAVEEDYCSERDGICRSSENVYELSLLGKHQLKNAAVVLKTIDVLRTRGWNISETAVEAGLKNVVWKARFEVLSRKPLFILDGGHNPQCAEALAENIEEYIYDNKLQLNNSQLNNSEKLPVNSESIDTADSTASENCCNENSKNSANRKCVTFLIGMLADKDYNKTLEILKPYGANYVCITPDSPRALSGRKLAEKISTIVALEEKRGKIKERKNLDKKINYSENVNIENICNIALRCKGQIENLSDEKSAVIRNDDFECRDNIVDVIAVEDIREAIDKALSYGLPVVAFGSLYSAGEIRKKFMERIS